MFFSGEYSAGCMLWLATEPIVGLSFWLLRAHNSARSMLNVLALSLLGTIRKTTKLNIVSLVVLLVCFIHAAHTRFCAGTRKITGVAHVSCFVYCLSLYILCILFLCCSSININILFASNLCATIKCS